MSKSKARQKPPKCRHFLRIEFCMCEIIIWVGCFEVCRTSKLPAGQTFRKESFKGGYAAEKEAASRLLPAAMPPFCVACGNRPPPAAANPLLLPQQFLPPSAALFGRKAAEQPHGRSAFAFLFAFAQIRLNLRKIHLVIRHTVLDGIRRHRTNTFAHPDADRHHAEVRMRLVRAGNVPSAKQ